MRSLNQILVVMVFFLSFDSIGVASTIMFLPGNSYFHTTISKKFLDSSNQGKPLHLRYVPTAGYFCGYFGTDELRIEDEDGKLLQNLTLVYRHIRNSSPQELEIQQKFKPTKSKDGKFTLEPDGLPRISETNKIHVFVYNADFDINKYKLLHLYNEKWFEEAPKYGNREPDEVVTTKEVFLESWRNGPQVPPLKVKTFGSNQVKRHAIPDGDLQLIVIEDRYYFPSIVELKAETEIYVINKQGVFVRWMDEEGKWTEPEPLSKEYGIEP